MPKGIHPALRWLRNAWPSDEDREAKATHGAYRTVFDRARPEGRRVLEDLAKYCNVQHSGFVPNDPTQTAFNEGQRDVFLQICGMLDLKPVDFVLPRINQED